MSWQTALPLYNFNPRSREGSDFNLWYDGNRTKDFNPRSREGSDVVLLKDKLTEQEFQSALPRGERPA